MKTKISAFLFAIAAATFLPVQNIQAQSKSPATVWDGVFTAAQADRGHTEFVTNCLRCHTDNHAATPDPRLRGEDFMERWREDTLDSLFNQMKLTMPPDPRSDAPRFSDAVFIDILSYLLQGNSFPAGNAELTTDVLDKIMLVGKDGPKPLPNFALVQVVGCLAQRPDKVWILSNAGEPVRTRKQDEVTAVEMRTAESRPPGTETIVLNDVSELLSDFLPDTHRGHKMAAKGFLVRQPNSTRVNLTWLQMVSPACEK